MSFMLVWLEPNQVILHLAEKIVSLRPHHGREAAKLACGGRACQLFDFQVTEAALL
jgi:hypothetical protein